MKIDIEYMVGSIEGIMELHDPEYPEIEDAKYMYEALKDFRDYLKVMKYDDQRTESVANH